MANDWVEITHQWRVWPEPCAFAGIERILHAEFEPRGKFLEPPVVVRVPVHEHGPRMHLPCCMADKVGKLIRQPIKFRHPLINIPGERLDKTIAGANVVRVQLLIPANHSGDAPTGLRVGDQHFAKKIRTSLVTSPWNGNLMVQTAKNETERQIEIVRGCALRWRAWP